MLSPGPVMSVVMARNCAAWPEEVATARTPPMVGVGVWVWVCRWVWIREALVRPRMIDSEGLGLVWSLAWHAIAANLPSRAATRFSNTSLVGLVRREYLCGNGCVMDECISARAWPKKKAQTL